MTQPALILRCPVQSSLLASVGYCPFTCIFDVELRDGSLYRYYGVPAHICWNLLCADSKGRYFNQYVKAAFPYHRLSPPQCSVGVDSGDHARGRARLQEPSDRYRGSAGSANRRLTP